MACKTLKFIKIGDEDKENDLTDSSNPASTTKKIRPLGMCQSQKRIKVN